MNENAIKITPEFILEVAMRRRWIILVPFCLALIVGTALALVLPKIYQASTLILIEPQRVPQNYVQPIVSSEASDRINTLSQQIMSRTNLEKIISDFNLFYSPERTNMYMEDKVNSLRRRIEIDITQDRRGTDAFSISFRGQDPQKVMQITNALATSFIDENLKVRESQALGTSDFLDAELKTMRQRLEQVEERIKEYRKNYMGELPEQLDTNLRILDRLQEDLNDRQQSIREARVRLAELNSAGSRSQQIVVIGSEQPRSGDGASVEELKARLETMSSRYTEKHPDILRLKKQIAEMEAKQESEMADNNRGRFAVSPSLPAELRRQILEARREIEVAEGEIVSLKKQISQYQKRVEETPKREQELLGLRRDYLNIQASYDSLLKRKLEADIAVNMERKQKGEQFRIVDPARLPQRPVAPDMRKLFLMVVAAGLAIGGGATFLLEYINTSFRSPDEIETMFELPVLTAIPTLLQPRQLMLRKLNNISSIAFAGLTMACFAVFAFVCR
jgi:polysaccharide chain length determinant protein (PEP-CTERM system associated)